jgi:HAD superfamily hydrolase (TIGR01509 family)
MNRLKPHLHGVIFDMDGTIIDTEQLWDVATNTLLANHGIYPDQMPAENRHAMYEKLIGIGLPQAMETLKDHFQMAHVSKNDMMKETIAIVKHLLKQKVRFMAGFEAFHTNLAKADIKTSIATNCDAESLQSIVEKMNFISYFGQNIYCVADVEHKAKPDPALFFHAAEKINATPEQCIVFEDSYWGFKAAAAANMKCIAVKNAKNAHLLAEHTHGAIDTYHEAEAELARIVMAYLCKQTTEK